MGNPYATKISGWNVTIRDDGHGNWRWSAERKGSLRYSAPDDVSPDKYSALESAKRQLKNT